MERRASIRDVAKVAGVSRQTVSRVLNEPHRVLPSTRAQVTQAIATLGYHPNAAARALRSRRTRTVGVLVGTASMFVAMSGLSELELALRREGLRVLIAGVSGDGLDAMHASVAPLLEFDVDALVVATNQRSAADLARELAGSRRIVAMQPGISLADGLSSVAVDFEAGVADVVEHLVARGDRRLAFVPGPGNLTTVEARTGAWIRQIGARQLPLLPMVEVAMTIEGGYEAGRRLLADGLPDAVLAVNDLVAMGILRVLRDEGVRVPDEVAVVGMDDIFGAELTEPSLSTLAQPWVELGSVAAELVVASMASEPPGAVRLRPTLLVRESSAGLRAPR